MPTLLQLKNVHKSFKMGSTAYDNNNGDTQAGNTIHVIKDLSLEIHNSDLLAITGPSGAGKSTLVHIMAGLEKPTSGEVLFSGKNIYTYTPQQLDLYRNKYIGFVFQFHYLLDDFSALENVMLPAQLGGEDGEEVILRAKNLLEKVGLGDRLKHYPKEMSGGEQQRVAVARALMNSPQILFADEPTGNLDKKNSDIVRDLLFAMRDDLGVAVVLITHDPNMAKLCDRHIELTK